MSSLVPVAAEDMFLLRLTDIDLNTRRRFPYNAIILGIGYIAGIVALVSYTNSYLVSTPHSSAGRPGDLSATRAIFHTAS